MRRGLFYVNKANINISFLKICDIRVWCSPVSVFSRPVYDNEGTGVNVPELLRSNAHADLVKPTTPRYLDLTY